MRQPFAERYARWVFGWPPWLHSLGVMLAYTVPFAALFTTLGLVNLALGGSVWKVALVPMIALLCLTLGSVIYGIAERTLQLDPIKDSFKLGLLAAASYPPTIYACLCLMREQVVPITAEGALASTILVLAVALLWRCRFAGRRHGRAE